MSLSRKISHWYLFWTRGLYFTLENENVLEILRECKTFYVHEIINSLLNIFELMMNKSS